MRLLPVLRRKVQAGPAKSVPTLVDTVSQALAPSNPTRKLLLTQLESLAATLPAEAEAGKDDPMEEDVPADKKAKEKRTMLPETEMYVGIVVLMLLIDSKATDAVRAHCRLPAHHHRACPPFRRPLAAHRFVIISTRGRRWRARRCSSSGWARGTGGRSTRSPRRFEDPSLPPWPLPPSPPSLCPTSPPNFPPPRATTSTSSATTRAAPRRSSSTPRGHTSAPGCSTRCARRCSRPTARRACTTTRRASRSCLTCW